MSCCLEASSGLVSRGSLVSEGFGTLGLVVSRSGCARQSWSGPLKSGVVWHVAVRPGMAVTARSGEVMSGKASSGGSC